MNEIDWGRRYARRTALGRFMSKIDRRSPDGCWLWTGAVTDHGYGSFRIQHRTYLAHRAMFMLWHGDVPSELDHLCRVHRCVNPDHLEPVTHRENSLRGISPAAQAARATQCINGHPWDAENTHFNPAGARRCRACARATQARIRLRKKASA